MGKTREIKKRIKAVGNIRRITKTMQMIATSKFAKAQQKATATKPYTEGVFELVRQLAATAGNVSHPLIAKPAGSGAPARSARSDHSKDLLLIITSDRGLCGPYNGSILRSAMAYFRDHPGARDGIIELVGKKGAGFMKYNGVRVADQHSQFGDKPTFETVEALAQKYMDRFVAGEITGVKVIYMKYISAGRQAPTLLPLLPLSPPASDAAPGAGAVEYEFSPPAEELLGSLIPAAVKATLYQAFNDAIVSEHVARMVAMKAATDNAGKMGKRLTRVYNRARQAQITTELTEIISGAAALE
ncbi:MAG: ATP synthase F1 subunit gamma [Phycisphaerales bacterium]